MRSFFNKIEKFIAKVKRDGLISATKKAFIKIKNDYLSKIDIVRNLKYIKHKKEIKSLLDEMLYTKDYDRIIIWRSSIGWNIPLFQRPQHLSNMLANQKCLVLYEVTKLTDPVDFIYKVKDNLYLVNYDIAPFVKLLNRKMRYLNKPKYLFTASTCWDLNEKIVKKYINDGYKFIYDYLDELSPVLAGTNKLPYNVEVIHNYVINNIDNCIVICTADRLYNDMVNKRKSSKNIVFACNGVNIEDFTNLKEKVKLSDDYLKMLKNKKPIIGYYGALASWFDYDLIKKLAESRPNYNIALIGAKYDNSYDQNNLEKYDNIYYFGPKKYYELPYYAKHFDVCTLPFLLNDITASTNPIKVFEYMALGKPIVTTALNECKKYESINIANNYDEFIKLVDNMLKNNDKNYYKKLKTEANENTWSKKANTIVNTLIDYEKTASFLSIDDVIEEILLKIYIQNYNTNIKDLVRKNISKKQKTFIVTINSETCMYSKEDESYRKMVLDKNVLLVPDSISITYVMKKAFKEKIDRYPGIDLLVDILTDLNKKKKSLYLYGSTEKVNNDMVKYVNDNFPNIRVVGHKNGYQEDETIVENEIIKLKPDAIVVALGIPKQEIFINKIYQKLDKGIMIGVGGSFDVLSGNVKRAPILMRKINLEWLYRILKDPKRFNKFYNKNIKFVFSKKRGIKE